MHGGLGDLMKPAPQSQDKLRQGREGLERLVAAFSEAASRVEAAMTYCSAGLGLPAGLKLTF